MHANCLALSSVCIGWPCIQSKNTSFSPSSTATCVRRASEQARERESARWVYVVWPIDSLVVWAYTYTRSSLLNDISLSVILFTFSQWAENFKLNIHDVHCAPVDIVAVVARKSTTSVRFFVVTLLKHQFHFIMAIIIFPYYFHSVVQFVVGCCLNAHTVTAIQVQLYAQFVYVANSIAPVAKHIWIYTPLSFQNRSFLLHTVISISGFVRTHMFSFVLRTLSTYEHRCCNCYKTKKKTTKQLNWTTITT